MGEASTLTMKSIMNEQRLKRRFDITTRTHLLWLWDQVKSGVDRLIANKTFRIHWGCEEVSILFSHFEDASLHSLMSAKDEPTEDSDFLFLCINQLIEAYNGFALKCNHRVVECENEIHPKTIMNGSIHAAAISSLSVILSQNFELLVESSWKRWTDDFDFEKISLHLLGDLSHSQLPVKAPLRYLREPFAFRKEDKHDDNDSNKIVKESFSRIHMITFCSRNA
jgi:hypothetical protein